MTTFKATIILAGETRPITVTSFDNIILANSIRFNIEPIMDRWVSRSQRGFIGGRSLLANVIENRGVDAQRVVVVGGQRGDCHHF